jgi:DNA-binding transcriptional MocR family regulator
VIPARPITQFVSRPGILDLGWGHPAPDALPVAAWATATVSTLERYGSAALAYGHPHGPGPLVDWLIRRIGNTDPRGCAPAEMFITAGASHALDLLISMLTEPGDIVLVDAPTYHLALRVITDHGVDVLPAPTDIAGIEPEMTARLVGGVRRAGRRVRLLYTVPTYANPTGASLPEPRRRDLVDLARHEQLTIIEDDTYRELTYDGTVPRSLWSLASADEVVRIGSFAKTVAPGLRLGWINSDGALIDRLADRGYVDSGGGVNHTVALTMATFGESGAYDRHLAQIRPRYRGQRDALVDGLRDEVPDVTNPAGGWFVWIRLPPGLSGCHLLPIAESHGVSFLDGGRFFPDGRGDDHVRLAFSMLAPADLTEAAHRFGAALRRAG